MVELLGLKYCYILNLFFFFKFYVVTVEFLSAGYTLQASKMIYNGKNVLRKEYLEIHKMKFVSSQKMK